MTGLRDEGTASDSLMALIQRLATLGVWQWEVASNSVTWSDELFRIYGLRKEEFAASFEGYLALVHPDDRERVQATVLSALQHGDRFSLEERIVRPDGAVRFLDTVGTVLRDPDGRPVRMVGACMDVTERRRLQDQIGEKERLAAIGTLAAGVAHELNNPLQYIRANLEALEEICDTPEAHAMFEDVVAGVGRMSAIVRDLQTNARPKASAVESVSLARVASESLAMVAHTLRHRATIEEDLDVGVHVSADRLRLGQAVVNLLTNAGQAIPPGRAPEHRVRVVVRREADRAVLEVIDTGVGLVEGTRHRIFEPFFTTREVGVGTGLGLFLTHRIVAEVGGAVQVVPQERGTLARITLPAVAESLPAPADEPTPTSPRKPLPRSCRVLVVDDDALLRRALGRMLRGHEAILAASMAEALAILDEDRGFDLVLCDLMMPDGLGSELYETAVERWPELAPRFRFITGGVFLPEVRDFVERHREHTLAKPFQRDELLSLLAELGAS